MQLHVKPLAQHQLSLEKLAEQQQQWRRVAAGKAAACALRGPPGADASSDSPVPPAQTEASSAAAPVRRATPTSEAAYGLTVDEMLAFDRMGIKHERPASLPPNEMSPLSQDLESPTPVADDPYEDCVLSESELHRAGLRPHASAAAAQSGPSADGQSQMGKVGGLANTTNPKTFHHSCWFRPCFCVFKASSLAHLCLPIWGDPTQVQEGKQPMVSAGQTLPFKAPPPPQPEPERQPPPPSSEPPLSLQPPPPQPPPPAVMPSRPPVAQPVRSMRPADALPAPSAPSAATPPAQSALMPGMMVPIGLIWIPYSCIQPPPPPGEPPPKKQPAPPPFPPPPRTTPPEQGSPEIMALKSIPKRGMADWTGEDEMRSADSDRPMLRPQKKAKSGHKLSPRPPLTAPPAHLLRND